MNALSTKKPLGKTLALAIMSLTFIAQAASPIPEIFSDKALNQQSITGKVFFDRNGDGLQNNNEQGISGVRLASVTGLVLETDEEGRFNLPDSGNHSQNLILKLDLSSLPHGTVITTENPRVILTSKIGLNKLNFGVQLFNQ